MLDAAFKAVTPEHSSAPLGPLFPPDVGPNAASGDGVFMEWKQCLDRWAALKKSDMADYASDKEERDAPEPSPPLAPLTEDALPDASLNANRFMQAVEKHVDYEAVGVADNELVELHGNVK